MNTPLDKAERWLHSMNKQAGRFLSAAELEAYQRIPEREREHQIAALLEKPIAHFSEVNDAFFRSRWAEVVEQVYQGSDLTLLEVATGDADMIPQMMARAYPGSTYITANMNRILSESLLRKTGDLPLKIVLYEDDAANITQYVTPSSVDLVAFQHGANDVMQAILCEREGIDTVYSDWMETLPAMIKLVQQEMANDTLAAHVKDPFVALIRNLLHVLKPGGFIVMNHYMYQLDLDWGYPEWLWENIIPVARGWLEELPGCEPMDFKDFDPQWWLFVKKL